MRIYLAISLLGILCNLPIRKVYSRPIYTPHSASNGALYRSAWWLLIYGKMSAGSNSHSWCWELLLAHLVKSVYRWWVRMHRMYIYQICEWPKAGMENKLLDGRIRILKHFDKFPWTGWNLIGMNVKFYLKTKTKLSCLATEWRQFLVWPHTLIQSGIYLEKAKKKAKVSPLGTCQPHLKST